MRLDDEMPVSGHRPRGRGRRVIPLIVENDGIRIRRMDLPEFSPPVANRCATCLICIQPENSSAAEVAEGRARRKGERKRKENGGFLGSRIFPRVRVCEVGTPLSLDASRRLLSLRSHERPFIPRRSNGRTFLLPHSIWNRLSCAAGIALPFYPVSLIARGSGPFREDIPYT